MQVECIVNGGDTMRIKDARVSQGFTQREFAQLIDITPEYLSQIEHQRRPLTVKVRRRSAEVLGIDPRVLE